MRCVVLRAMVLTAVSKNIEDAELGGADGRGEPGEVKPLSWRTTKGIAGKWQVVYLVISISSPTTRPTCLRQRYNRYPMHPRRGKGLLLGAM